MSNILEGYKQTEVRVMSGKACETGTSTENLLIEEFRPIVAALRRQLGWSHFKRGMMQELLTGKMRLA